MFKIIQKLPVILGVACVLCAITILFLQIACWLYYGHWTPWPISILLENSAWLWLANDSEWIGLKTILNFLLKIPLSLCLFILGVYLSTVEFKLESPSTKSTN